jgi:hypothetical protein|nr:MAG TPA: hypothetical protein [Caudoviricetes sp.]
MDLDNIYKRAGSRYLDIAGSIEAARQARENQINKGVMNEGATIEPTIIEKAMSSTGAIGREADEVDEIDSCYMPEVREFKKAIDSQNLTVADVDLQLKRVQRHLTASPNDPKLNQIKEVLLDRRDSLQVRL